MKCIDKKQPHQCGRCACLIEWGKYDSLLGTLPDAHLALTIGCSKTTVGRRRQRRGIAVYAIYPPRVPWEQYESLFGIVPDIEIAEMLDCHKATISGWRAARGIAPPPRHPRNPHTRKFDHSLLGTRPDMEIVEQCNVSQRAVWGARKRKGIPVFSARVKCLICENEFAWDGYTHKICNSPSCRRDWTNAHRSDYWRRNLKITTPDDVELRMCIIRLVQFRRMILKKEGIL